MASDDGTLIKIAVFGITMSIMCTVMISIVFSSDADGDYDFDTIQQYRDDLSKFTGESMLNKTPWVLTSVNTPWLPEDGVEGHLSDDGWLYGESITASEEDPEDPTIPYYSYIGQSANIKLDPEHKSSILISVGEATYDYEYVDGVKWWADEDGWWSKITKPVGEFFGADQYEYATGTAHTWDYTGYRYVFDPTLPFADTQTQSVKDGALSVVWYSYNGQEGLSGALDVYGGEVLLASYSAADIISAYDSTTGYAIHYDFDFEGTALDLYIQFDEDDIQAGMPLMEAWTTGEWSMAISSETVGNFLDIENSTSYSVTGGSMIRTFIQIYTLSLPNIHNDWMNVILWLLVGLPMTLSLALITLRVMSAVKIL